MEIIRDRIISVFELNGFFLPFDSCSDIDITEYDISSLNFVSIIIGIEDEFDLEIPDERLTLDIFKSFNGLVELITVLENNKNK